MCKVTLSSDRLANKLDPAAEYLILVPDLALKPEWGRLTLAAGRAILRLRGSPERAGSGSLPPAGFLPYAVSRN